VIARTFRESDAVRVLSLAVVLGVLLVLRRPDAFFNAQFWAEDGLVFFADDVLAGGWTSLLHPYAGYLHVVPRLVAVLADPLPAAYVPLFYNACAIVVAAACCALFASASYRFLIASDTIRVALCVLFTVAPFADEFIGTISNLQWYLSFGALLLVIAPAPAGLTLRTVAISVIVLLCSLSAPQTVLFVPLAMWRASKRRDTAAAPGFALIAGVAAQVAMFLSQRASVAGSGFDALQVATATAVAFSTRVVMSTIVGSADALQIAAAAPFVAPIVAAAVLCVIFALVRKDRPRAVHAAVVTALMVAALVLALSFRGTAALFASFAHMTPRGERYFLLPTCLLLVLAGIAIDGARGRARAYLVAVALLLVGVGTAHNVRVTPFIDDRWVEYAPRIAAWRAADAAHLRAPPLTVPINPTVELQLPEESAIGPDTAKHWENRLVQRTGSAPEDQKVYLVRNGRRRWVLHGSWLLAHGYGWPNDVNHIRAAELDAIPLGDPISEER
jgi:hypothetical protein